MWKKVFDYLLRMIDDCLSDRWVIYDGDKWSLKDEITYGTSRKHNIPGAVYYYIRERSGLLLS